MRRGVTYIVIYTTKLSCSLETKELKDKRSIPKLRCGLETDQSYAYSLRQTENLRSSPDQPVKSIKITFASSLLQVSYLPFNFIKDFLAQETFHNIY